MDRKYIESKIYGETLRKSGSKYQVEKIDFNRLKQLSNRSGAEGIVLLGAGGDIDEWINGVSGMLNDEGISDSPVPEDNFMGAYSLTTIGGRTDLVLIFLTKNQTKKLSVGKLAMWRLRFGDCSWLSDYLTNYADQH